LIVSTSAGIVISDVAGFSISVRLTDRSEKCCDHQTRNFPRCRRRTPEMGYPVPVFPITKAGIKTDRSEPSEDFYLRE